ncbi:uncharacterized protein Dwil_GK20651 [Drosophila willistoni]|uniref:Uncharacterized protein n=1 Tax=Drosophila willistoni TaxID=7260 RepID=B4MK92_DROWI|nr:uncharacterized protein LOC6638318 [Drosophila willistoni]EDW72531.1 uncharacterized protein Dwil_GK20651 [Drosophila willistoni]
MQSVITFTFVLSLVLAIGQSAPIISSTDISGNPVPITSQTDITGELVRQKRANRDYYQGDYFICYPSSAVYGQHGAATLTLANRRSDNGYSSGNSPFDSFEARKDRADRERAAYTDSYGK